MVLGFYTTAEEAALRVARTPEGQAAAAAALLPPAPPPMTADEALRQAEAEGLMLETSENSSTGYKYVNLSKRPYGEAKPYQAAVRRGGKLVALGSFATAEEAALVLARDLRLWSAQQAPSAATMAASAAPAKDALIERRGRVQPDAPCRAQLDRAVVGSSCPQRGTTSAVDATNAANTAGVVLDAVPLPKGRLARQRARADGWLGGPHGEQYAVEADDDGVLEEPEREVTVIDGIEFVATFSHSF